MVSIRALREEDDTSSFDSGNDHLDRFFRRHAAKNQFFEYIGTTYVAIEAKEILGYAGASSSRRQSRASPCR